MKNKIGLYATLAGLISIRKRMQDHVITPSSFSSSPLAYYSFLSQFQHNFFPPIKNVFALGTSDWVVFISGSERLVVIATLVCVVSSLDR